MMFHFVELTVGFPLELLRFTNAGVSKNRNKAVSICFRDTFITPEAHGAVVARFC